MCKLNQKGFAFLPILIWTIIGSVVVALGIARVKSGEFSKTTYLAPSITTENNQVLSATSIPNPQPSIVTISPSSVPTSPKKSSQPVINCAGPDGKTLHMSQADCDKFNAAWGKSADTSQTNTNQTPQDSSGQSDLTGNHYIDTVINNQCIIDYTCSFHPTLLLIDPKSCSERQAQVKAQCDGFQATLDKCKADAETKEKNAEQADTSIKTKYDYLNTNEWTQYITDMYNCNLQWRIATGNE